MSDSGKKSDLHDFAMTKHAETAKALFLSETGEKEDAVWIPKSQIEIEASGGAYIVTMPEWLAVEKGLF
jgi:hypothetical protein